MRTLSTRSEHEFLMDEEEEYRRFLDEMDYRKEGKMTVKAYQIRNAFTWLRRFEKKANGQLSYVNPHIYTVERCKEIITAVNDIDLEKAGVPVKEARRLVAEVKDE